MRTLTRAFFTQVIRALPVLILPSVVLASGGEEGGWRQVWDLVWRIVNFAILVGILLYFTRKPVVNAIRNSIESVKTLVKEAKESRRESEATLKKAEDKLAGVDAEISELLDSARRESEAERERILTEASEAMEKLKTETALAIEQELKKARDILKKETADLAVALAEEILKKNIKPDDQSRFVEEYLEKLEANH